MKRIRIMGICLVAALALAAVVAGTASALPEIGRCVAQAGTGKYKDSNCTEKAKTLASEKQFEFKKGPEPGKTGLKSAGGEGVLETVSGTRIVCTTQSATAKLKRLSTGVTKEVESVIAKFEGCGIPAIGAICKSKGEPEGTISTFSLKGPIGYISGEKTKTPAVGQELTPTKAKGLFAEFECLGGGLVVKVKGKEGAAPEGRVGGNCIIAPVTPPNVMSTTATQEYEGSGGAQKPQHFQDKGTTKSKFCNLESNTNGGAFEAATQALTTVVTSEEALEIKA
ncbi:MAG TPA: hypothetical protein VHY83_01125 [Solirubrobacteraceae bacterium]|jgi:hypothetical protein|nr:hypothetical protein [Solirubrobacteraceae bacterium]